MDMPYYLASNSIYHLDAKFKEENTMILKYINTMARLEKREGKLGTMIGILLSIVMLLIGIMIVMFGLHIMSKASINLLEYINDIKEFL